MLKLPCTSDPGRGVRDAAASREKGQTLVQTDWEQGRREQRSREGVGGEGQRGGALEAARLCVVWAKLKF
jgi:hypothetical protein